MSREAEVTRFLCERMALDQVEEFYRRFGGYRVPKRSEHLTHQRRMQVLVACLIRTVNRTTSLSVAAERAIAAEFDMTPKAVRNTWSAWNRTGRPRADKKGGTTKDATKPESLRW